MRNLVLAGLFALSLLPFSSASAFAAKLIAKVDISSQTMVVTHNGKVKYKWPVSTGRKGYSTPTGSYSAKWLSRHHRSRKYNNAPMPWTLRLTWDGIAIHGGSTVELGYASHGCIGVPDEFASRLFAIARRGDQVIITDGVRTGVGGSLASGA